MSELANWKLETDEDTFMTMMFFRMGSLADLVVCILSKPIGI